MNEIIKLLTRGVHRINFQRILKATVVRYRLCKLQHRFQGVKLDRIWMYAGSRLHCIEKDKETTIMATSYSSLILRNLKHKNKRDKFLNKK